MKLQSQQIAGAMRKEATETKRGELGKDQDPGAKTRFARETGRPNGSGVTTGRERESRVVQRKFCSRHTPIYAL